jgi:hypothetical protein
MSDETKEEGVTITEDDLENWEKGQNQFLDPAFVDQNSPNTSDSAKEEEAKADDSKSPEDKGKAEAEGEEDKSSPDEKSESEDESEAKKQDSQDGEANTNWEKRATDNQAAFTRSQQELRKTEKELQAHRELVARFKENVKYDENGLPIGWDFKAESDKKNEPDLEPPTDEEWVENPKAASEKDFEYRWQQKKKKEAAERQEAEQSDAAKKEEAEFKEKWNDTYQKTGEEFPDALNVESELYKAAEKEFELDQELSFISSGPRIAIERAARKLGVKAVEPKTEAEKAFEGKSEEKKAEPKKVDKSKKVYLTQVGNSGSSSGGKTVDPKDKLAIWQEDQKKFLA